MSASPAATGFLPRVLMLTGASTIAPLVILLSQPLLTRLYLPAQYGAFGIFEAILAILVSLAALGYHLPIPVREKEAEAQQLLIIAIATVTLFSVATWLATLFFSAAIAGAFDAALLAPYLWLLPLAVFCSGCYQAYNAWALRRQSFPAIAQARLSQGLGQASVQIVLGLFGFNIVGLLYGLVVGRLAAMLVLVRSLGVMAPLAAASSNWSTRTLLATAWRNRNFPLLATWSGAISVISLQISVLLVGYFFGVETVGYFSLAFMVVAGPVHIINGAVVQTFLAGARTLQSEGVLAQASLDLFRHMTRLGLVPALLLAAYAPTLFAAVFGEEWRTAGDFARLLAPAAVISFMGSHLPAIVILKNRQRPEFIFTCLHLAARILALAGGAALADAIHAVGAYALVSIVFLLSYDAWLLRVAGNTQQTVTALFMQEGAVALLLVSPLWLGPMLWQTPQTMPFFVLSLIGWLVLLLVTYPGNRRSSA